MKTENGIWGLKYGKFTGWGLIGVLVVAFYADIWTTGSTQDDLFTIAGVGFLLFAIWGGVILIKNSK